LIEKLDNLIFVEFFNISVAVTKFAKNCFRVLPQSGNWTKARRATGMPQWTPDNWNPPYRRLDLPNHVSREGLGMIQDFANTSEDAMRQVPLTQSPEPLVMQTLKKNLLNYIKLQTNKKLTFTTGC
jgi:hypothetical protein